MGVGGTGGGTSLENLLDDLFIIVDLFELSGTDPDLSVCGDTLPSSVQHTPRVLVVL